MNITLWDHANGHSSALDPEMLVLNKKKEKLNAFRDRFQKETVTVFLRGHSLPTIWAGTYQVTHIHTYIHRAPLEGPSCILKLRGCLSSSEH